MSNVIINTEKEYANLAVPTADNVINNVIDSQPPTYFEASGSASNASSASNGSNTFIDSDMSQSFSMKSLAEQPWVDLNNKEQDQADDKVKVKKEAEMAFARQVIVDLGIENSTQVVAVLPVSTRVATIRIKNTMTHNGGVYNSIWAPFTWPGWVLSLPSNSYTVVQQKKYIKNTRYIITDKHIIKATKHNDKDTPGCKSHVVFLLKDIECVAIERHSSGSGDVSHIQLKFKQQYSGASINNNNNATIIGNGRSSYSHSRRQARREDRRAYYLDQDKTSHFDAGYSLCINDKNLDKAHGLLKSLI